MNTSGGLGLEVNIICNEERGVRSSGGLQVMISALIPVESSICLILILISRCSNSSFIDDDDDDDDGEEECNLLSYLEG